MSSAVTQCPHCHAKFRVRAEQARAHGGLVRCGACRGIFDARLNLIEGSLGESDDEFDTSDSPQTILAGVPPVARAPSEEEVRAAAREAVAKPASQDSETRDANASAALTGAAIAATDASYDWRAPQHPLTRGQKIGYAFLSLLATLVLLAQSAYWFRDELASRFPAFTPTLSAACGYLKCRVSPPKRPQQLGFVGAELAADPAHKGLLIFTATLRNSGQRPVAHPSLVLTLDGTNGEPLARRIFTPEQYAPANANLAQGLDGGADLEVKLYLDVSPASPVGFKADHAYF